MSEIKIDKQSITDTSNRIKDQKDDKNPNRAISELKYIIKYTYKFATSWTNDETGEGYLIIVIPLPALTTTKHIENLTWDKP